MIYTMHGCSLTVNFYFFPGIFLSLTQFREKRIEQEKELLQKQVTWSNEELKTKTEELVNLRKEKVPVHLHSEKLEQCTCVSFFCISRLIQCDWKIQNVPNAHHYWVIYLISHLPQDKCC